MTTNHIPLAALFERVRMKAELDGETRSHLAGCDSCRNQLKWMEIAAELDPHDPPQTVVDRAVQIGRSGFGLKRLRRAIAALLTFDSFKDLAPAGIRSGESASRQMTFEGDGLEIGIWLKPSQNKTITLSGQVSDKSTGPITDDSARVDLVVEGDHIQTTSLTSWGEFLFTEVPEDEYGLSVYFSDRVLQIPSLPITAKEQK
jgi:hypothetical protein